MPFMRVQKVSLLALGIIGIVYGALCAGNYLANRPLAAPRNDTINRLRVIEYLIQQAECKSGKRIIDLLGKESPLDHSYNAAMVDLIGTNFGKGCLKTSNGKTYLIDAWGNPFLVFRRRVALAQGYPEALLDEGQQVVIWSAGPNESNESGRGDDISLGFERAKYGRGFQFCEMRTRVPSRRRRR
jgi:hypothetical protein